MRFVKKILVVSSIAGIATGLTGSAYAKPAAPNHPRSAHLRAHLRAPALPHGYGYVPAYAYYHYQPTRVFRCYPARLMVEDQVGFVAGYVPLGTCG